jgi:SAM-dependent methyltransferase
VQQVLFPSEKKEHHLDSSLWHGSFNSRECSFHQLSPYIGKLKSGMVQVLIDTYTQPNAIILDPFCASGVVPLEAVIAGRIAWANDLSPYAFTLTKGKLEAPNTYQAALENTAKLLDVVQGEAPSTKIDHVPDWVQSFFHPDTLREIVTAYQILLNRQDHFLLSCLCGILHHQRPGFLSFPSSHLVPYLRKSRFPPEQFPELYEYRSLSKRLLAKVHRAYKRAPVLDIWKSRQYQIWQTNAMNLPIASQQVDTIITSPPYFGALDYARDNRLRLWFLGCKDWKALDQELTASRQVYLSQMEFCLREMDRVLKPGGYCLLVLGDVDRDGTLYRTAEILADMAISVTDGRWVKEQIYDDIIPDDRRTRRRTKTTKFERILVMRKAP